MNETGGNYISDLSQVQKENIVESHTWKAKKLNLEQRLEWWSSGTGEREISCYSMGTKFQFCKLITNYASYVRSRYVLCNCDG